MKKIFISAVFTACIGVAGAASPNPAATNRAERAALHRARMEARIAANGGLVSRPYTGKYVVIVNNQSRVDEKDFFDPRQSIQNLFRFPVKIVKPGTDVSKEALIITLSDDQNAPALLVAPEIPWAGINVGALAADKPDKEKLSLRLRKEIWRAFMYACGAANSTMQPCVMRPIFGLRDLDSQKTAVPSPDAFPRVVTTANALGIGEIVKCDYRQACREGWAPAPTNDVQRAIQREVNSEKEKGPSNAIKISPPKK